MSLLAHITGYETPTVIAVFVLGVLIGVAGSYLIRAIHFNRSR